MKLVMNYIRPMTLLALMSVIALLCKAQSSLIFYHTYDQFNSSNFNPAFLTSQKKFTFSIFPLAGISVGYNNQEVIKDVSSKVLPENQTNVNFKDVFNGLIKKDLFLLHFESSLLNLGYNSYLGSFSFQIKENLLMMSNFKGRLTDFLLEPTFQTVVINQPQLFPVEAIHYREYSLGYAKEVIKNKLSIGIRAKLYFGKSILFSEVSGAIVEEAKSFHIRISGPMKLSIPADPQYQDEFVTNLNIVSNLDIGSYIKNTKNVGTGLDFGFKYTITPEIVFSASMVDLGRINWKNNLHTLLFKGNQELPIQSIEKNITANGTEILIKKDNNKPLTDSITTRITTDGSAFSKPLPTTFYAGLKYQLNTKLNIGMIDRYTKIKGLKYNNFSLIATYDANKKLSLITGYSIHENSYNNIPAGILYKWDSGQSYIGTDNFLSLLFPSSTAFSGITFGTCFYLFRRKVKYEEPLEYLPFYKQKKAKPTNKKGLLFNNYTKT